jgi:hypothetical protein
MKKHRLKKRASKSLIHQSKKADARAAALDKRITRLIYGSNVIDQSKTLRNLSREHVAAVRKSMKLRQAVKRANGISGWDEKSIG